MTELCSDCPPWGYPTEKTRCRTCPRRYNEALFVHITKENECKHEFVGWRDFEDGNGGEAVCKYCGLGAMAYTLRHGP